MERKLNIIITETQLKKLVTEQRSFMGKYEGEEIKVSALSNRKLPKSIVLNILNKISKEIGSEANISRYNRGEYDKVKITLFGQLMAYLTSGY